MTGPFEGLPLHSFRCIMADPPWSFKTFSKKGLGKSAQSHYECMTLADIEALPVADLAHPEGCTLALWATFPMLPQALGVMSAWGFRYKSGEPWAKRSRGGKAWAFGTGYWFRNASELLLIGTRGKARPMVRNVRGLIVAPLREHSRKPVEARAQVEALTLGPRLELFARESAGDWASWGNQVDRFPRVEP
jgi:N6-adenosine-specific RNA methylase IME4